MKLKIVLPRSLRELGEPAIMEMDCPNQKSLIQIMKEVLGKRYDLVFEDNGSSKGFAKIFHNDICIDSVQDICVSDGDELEIITAMSGG